MMTVPEIELISFDICPYVQRSVITLLEKEVPFKLTHIDIDAKPNWFLKASPLGKVPVLRSGDFILFESSVINEYLDEITPPALSPSEPKRKAHNRAWIEYASQLLAIVYQITTRENKKGVEESVGLLKDRLGHLERNLSDGPFFNGMRFSLVDAAFAPLFIRLDTLVAPALGENLLESLPKTSHWADALLAKPSVQQACPDNFVERASQRFNRLGSYLFSNDRNNAQT